MNRIKCLIIIGCAMLIMGCPARSLFPLLAEKDLVFNPDLIGTWIDKESEEFTFQKSGDKGYNVLWREQDGDTVLLKVQLGKLGKFLYLDSYPGLKQIDHHLLRAHVISKIWLKGDTLRVASLESDYLREMVVSGKLKTPHALVEGDVILTASTEELQQLVLSLAENDAAFPNPSTLVRHK